MTFSLNHYKSKGSKEDERKTELPKWPNEKSDWQPETAADSNGGTKTSMSKCWLLIREKPGWLPKREKPTYNNWELTSVKNCQREAKHKLNTTIHHRPYNNHMVSSGSPQIIRLIVRVLDVIMEMGSKSTTNHFCTYICCARITRSCGCVRKYKLDFRGHHACLHGNLDPLRW